VNRHASPSPTSALNATVDHVSAGSTRTYRNAACPALRRPSLTSTLTVHPGRPGNGSSTRVARPQTLSDSEPHADRSSTTCGDARGPPRLNQMPVNSSAPASSPMLQANSRHPRVAPMSGLCTRSMRSRFPELNSPIGWRVPPLLFQWVQPVWSQASLPSLPLASLLLYLRTASRDGQQCARQPSRCPRVLLGPASAGRGLAGDGDLCVSFHT